MRLVLDWMIRYFVRKYEALDASPAASSSQRLPTGMKLRSAATQGRN